MEARKGMDGIKKRARLTRIFNRTQSLQVSHVQGKRCKNSDCHCEGKNRADNVQNQAA